MSYTVTTDTSALCELALFLGPVVRCIGLAAIVSAGVLFSEGRRIIFPCMLIIAACLGISIWVSNKAPVCGFAQVEAMQ